MARAAMKYNPGFLTDQELVDSFCVRVAEFEMLVETIRESTGSSNPHQLVVGPRGTGKTTLLLRVAVEVKRDPELKSAWFPIIFPEESYEIATCGEFWMQCLAHLGNQAPQGSGGMDLARTLAEVRHEQDDQRLAGRCLDAILEFADQENKRLLLIVENLNMLFDDINEPDVGWQLRHTLQNEKRILLFASATSRFEEIERYGRAMYDLFHVQDLRRLDTDACAVLWKAVSNRDPDRNVVRSLEILTGGNPRLLAIVARFGAMLSFHELMDNLLRLVDDHTEYFKSHLDFLGVQDRRVYLALARLWRPATAREVAEQARLPTNNCSALLGRLVDRGAILIAGGEPRRKQYYIAERMYNIYYLLRMGRGSDRLVEALVRFMRTFYSRSELEDYLNSLWSEPDNVDETIIRQFRRALDSIDYANSHTVVESSELEELSEKLDNLVDSGAWDRVIEVCEKIESLISPDAALPEQEDLANARFCHVVALVGLGRVKEASSLSPAICSDYLDGDTQLQRFVAATAGRLRLSMLNFLRHSSEDILRECDQFIDQFGWNDSTYINEMVSEVLFKKIMILIALNRKEESLANIDKFIERYGEIKTPEIVQKLSLVLLERARIEIQAGRLATALDTVNSVLVTSEELGIEVRLDGFLIRSEIYIMSDRIDASKTDIAAALELLPELSEVPGTVITKLLGYTIRTGNKSILDLIEASSSADILHPLAVALRQELDIAAPVAMEVSEVAKDIRSKLAVLREQDTP